ncbi:CRISPR-associated protein Csd1 [Aequitasia blattaphilus]|uniref:Type I-C CRISPR-associated protein Cas8c/Csd1 n=1 Tax=Aequitasia blattaphilus TaxID=2949332 RepID=A0ABT1E879_9FIRM|nr:type I-C CRISPR-associated protein Cas8c/Csd1 [Aequitasia blattaphilus]MCP1102029.1 type I-C CRISPR-associated protein Cas8c/Csd1 [Aequitasia blattaphilus]MCR8614669.1 type I-C CRISPR-associated protein Cas8c/Csd1 [Aequitasia blattaphilus]
MSWMYALYDTYNKLEKSDKIFSHEGLLKIGHSTQQAHIEIVLDSLATFKGASFVDKEHAETVIPVTEGSSSRSSGVEPHPLFDKLKYIAGDYQKYCDEDNEKYYQAYLEQLRNWSESQYTDERINALYKYLRKGTLIEDIASSGIFSLDDSGILTKKWNNAEGYKLTAGEQKDAFVRFRVLGTGKLDALWQDEELQDKYSQYYLHKGGNNQLCYVTGKEGRGCNNHPSKIRHSGDKAKMISANDTSNFTFRGRFKNAQEAYMIGYEASQKVHNALKWLIRNQGVRLGDKVFVLWSTKNEDMPDLFGSTAELLGVQKNEVTTKKTFAEHFNKAILGYKKLIADDSHFVILGVDAATTGRLSIVFQREYVGQQGSELISNIEKWHKTCCWNFFFKNDEGRYIPYFGAPAPINIAKAAFGTDQGGFLKGNDKVFAQTVERILPCICDGRKIPKDIVDTVFNKAKHPQNYSNLNLWLNIVATFCALYNKYLYDYKEEEIIMDIMESNDISYNCGRLLAIADAIESWALREKAGENASIRSTNAMRYFTRFTSQPSDTWKYIRSKLIPYQEQLGTKGNYLYYLLGEVSLKIDDQELKKATNLDGNFVLGFDSQRTAIINRAIELKAEKEANEAKEEED